MGPVILNYVLPINYQAKLGTWIDTPRSLKIPFGLQFIEPPNPVHTTRWAHMCRFLSIHMPGLRPLSRILQIPIFQIRFLIIHSCAVDTKSGHLSPRNYRKNRIVRRIGKFRNLIGKIGIIGNCRILDMYEDYIMHVLEMKMIWPSRY